VLYSVSVSKFKAYRGPKKQRQSVQNGLPCLILVIIGFIIVSVVFYYGLQPS
jgi:hypothetical protein